MLLACKSGGYNNQLIEKINWKNQAKKNDNNRHLPK